jgi:adenine C2-methylase RlmN of 23S rRNA A2503 and tRNA A37
VHCATTRRRADKRVTLAYVVLGGVNATPEHCARAGALIGDTRVKLNLIDVSDDTGATAARHPTR